MQIKNSVTGRIGVWGLAVLVLSLGLVVNFWLSSKRALAQRPTPYTVSLEQSRLYPNGEQKYVNIQLIAVRSDGSMVEKFSSPPGSDHPEVFRTVYLSQGLAIGIRDLAALKYTMTVDSNSNNAERPRLPANQCVYPGTQESYLGTETLEGYRAAKVTSGQMFTSWYALDYSCALIGSQAVWKDGSTTVKKLISLVSGEPDPALFYIPSSYKEVPPSQWHYINGAPIPESERKLMDKLDATYWKRRPTSVK
jgi:hypothetical protein